MLTDYWVLGQLIAGFCSFFLLLKAGFSSISFIRFWNKKKSSERQIKLERQSYLLSAILNIVLGFQILSLILFLNTVNNHLPNFIKGAMCATGVLEINDFGYPLLFLKLFSVFLYGVFMVLNYWDNAEPNYPLTPIKYWFIFPILILSCVDIFFSYSFFAEIEPDIIATCCSVQFNTSGANYGFIEAYQGFFQDFMIVFWWVCFIILIILHFFLKARKAIFHILHLIFAIGFVFFSVFNLKYHFVKYIYGLPTHNCLFDIFWIKYQAIGYVIFGSYYFVIGASLFLLLYIFVQKHLKHSHKNWLNKVQMLGFLGTIFSFVFPYLYWWFWTGNL